MVRFLFLFFIVSSVYGESKKKLEYSVALRGSWSSVFKQESLRYPSSGALPHRFELFKEDIYKANRYDFGVYADIQNITEDGLYTAIGTSISFGFESSLSPKNDSLVHDVSTINSSIFISPELRLGYAVSDSPRVIPFFSFAFPIGFGLKGTEDSLTDPRQSNIQIGLGAKCVLSSGWFFELSLSKDLLPNTILDPNSSFPLIKMEYCTITTQIGLVW
jgi:hypothetical protein